MTEAATATPTDRSVDYRRGAAITLPSSGPCLGQVVSGLVGVVRTDRCDRQAVIELVTPGGTVAEETLVGARILPTGSRLEALVPTRVQWSEPQALEAASVHDVTTAVLSILAMRTRLLHDLSCRRRWQSRSQQIAQLFVDVTTPTAQISAPDQRVRLSQGSIARILGADPRSVSKNCRAFRDRGWLRPDGRELVVATEALKVFAAAGVRRDGTGLSVRHRLLASQAELASLLGLARPAEGGAAAARVLA